MVENTTTNPAISRTPRKITTPFMNPAPSSAFPAVALSPSFGVPALAMTIPAPDIRTLVAGDDDAGDRLDRFLHRNLPDVSRSRFKDLTKAGFVTIGQQECREPS